MSTRPKNPGARRGSRTLTTGERLLSNRLKGNGGIDLRSTMGRMMRETTEDLYADRGGIERCTAGERILIEEVAAERVILRSMRTWIFQQPGPVGPDGELLNVLRKGYTSHLSAFTRALAALGVRPGRVEEPISLDRYLRDRLSGRENGPILDCTPEGEATLRAPSGKGQKCQSTRAPVTENTPSREGQDPDDD